MEKCRGERKEIANKQIEKLLPRFPTGCVVAPLRVVHCRGLRGIIPAFRLYLIVSFGEKEYYTILYYTILYYTILYYTILYYTILYYTTLWF